MATGSRPKIAEAYDLYLHALAFPHDPGPNKDAIAVLQQVVGWTRTTLRVGGIGTAGLLGHHLLRRRKIAFQLSNTACERALALDPNLTIAAGQLITNRVERGELGKAYEAAQALVNRRPKAPRPTSC